MTWQKIALIVIPGIALALGATSDAQAGFITNGSFELTTNGNGQPGFNTTISGWTSTGYNFVYAPGTADTTGAVGHDGTVKLWGPGTSSANGLTATSPDLGNFIAADGAFEVGPISQSLTGLTVGHAYAVSFWWAGAQQSGFTGVTTDQWKVSFGGSTQSTAVATNVNHGFTGWMQQTFTFIADNTTDTLSFLAVGTPTGEPPFSLLDGVSVNPVPEPSTVVLMGIGLVGGVVVRLRRRARSAAL
jgi:hypothetical protein